MEYQHKRLKFSTDKSFTPNARFELLLTLAKECPGIIIEDPRFQQLKDKHEVRRFMYYIMMKRPMIEADYSKLYKLYTSAHISAYKEISELSADNEIPTVIAKNKSSAYPVGHLSNVSFSQYKNLKLRLVPLHVEEITNADIEHHRLFDAEKLMSLAEKKFQTIINGGVSVVEDDPDALHDYLLVIRELLLSTVPEGPNDQAASSSGSIKQQLPLIKSEASLEKMTTQKIYNHMLEDFLVKIVGCPVSDSNDYSTSKNSDAHPDLTVYNTEINYERQKEQQDDKELVYATNSVTFLEFKKSNLRLFLNENLDDLEIVTSRQKEYFQSCVSQCLGYLKMNGTPTFGLTDTNVSILFNLPSTQSLWNNDLELENPSVSGGADGAVIPLQYSIFVNGVSRSSRENEHVIPIQSHLSTLIVNQIEYDKDPELSWRREKLDLFAKSLELKKPRGHPSRSAGTETSSGSDSSIGDHSGTSRSSRPPTRGVYQLDAIAETDHGESEIQGGYQANTAMHNLNDGDISPVDLATMLSGKTDLRKPVMVDKYAKPFSDHHSEYLKVSYHRPPKELSGLELRFNQFHNFEEIFGDNVKLPFEFDFFERSETPYSEVYKFKTEVFMTYFVDFREELASTNIWNYDYVILKVLNPFSVGIRDSDEDYTTQMENVTNYQNKVFDTEKEVYQRISKYNDSCSEPTKKLNTPELLAFGRDFICDYEFWKQNREGTQHIKKLNDFQFFSTEGSFLLMSFIDDPKDLETKVDLDEFYRQGRNQLEILHEEIKINHNDIAYGMNLKYVNHMMFLYDFGNSTDRDQEKLGTLNIEEGLYSEDYDFNKDDEDFEELYRQLLKLSKSGEDVYEGEVAVQYSRSELIHNLSC